MSLAKSYCEQCKARPLMLRQCLRCSATYCRDCRETHNPNCTS